MKKIVFLLAFSFLFFFLFVPDTFAKTMSDYMEDKNSYQLEDNEKIFSNLDFDNNFDVPSHISFYRGQRTNTEELNDFAYGNKYSTGGALYFDVDNAKQTLFADNDNISSFIYGSEFSLHGNFEKDKKYEYAVIISTSDEVDYHELVEGFSDYTITGRLPSGDPPENFVENAVSDKNFMFFRETSKDSDAIHYWFFFQFVPVENLSTLNFYLGDKDLAFNDSTFKYIDNLSNKDIAISLAEVRFFEVDSFSTYEDLSSGDLGDSFDSVTEVCDTMDFACHFRNLKNWFKSLVSTILDGISSLLKLLFIPDSDDLNSVFDTLSNYFSNKLGFLLFPFEFIVDFLNRFINIPNNPVKVLTVPSISIGSFGTLIQGFSFNIAEYWESGPFSQIYTIYLIFVHAFIGFGLYKLCLHKYNEIVGGKSK